MKNILFHLTILLVSFQFLSCAEEDNLPLEDTVILVDADAFDAAQTDNLTINSMSLNGDFLVINFSSSGCSGESWIVKVIDSGSLMYTNPPQRNLVLSLENNELCEALITKEIAIDISALQVGGNSVWLKFKNYDQKILYQY